MSEYTQQFFDSLLNELNTITKEREKQLEIIDYDSVVFPPEPEVFWPPEPPKPLTKEQLEQERLHHSLMNLWRD